MAKEKIESKAFPSVSFDEFAPTSYDAWKAEAVETLKGAPFEKRLLTKTYEGITLQPIYTSEDCAGLTDALTFPGFEDYLRGEEAGGYLETPWQIAQSPDAHDPAAANAILREGLSRGATTTCFDATRLCLASSDAFSTLMKGICPIAHPLSVFAGYSALELLEQFAFLAKSHGHATADLSGCVGADPVGVYAKEGTLPVSLATCFDELAEAVRFAKTNCPKLKTIYIRGSVYHNGGANAVQELAFSFAVANVYFEELTKRGLTVDEISAAMRFEFSLGANFFMEIAKLRAARIVWAELVKLWGGKEAKLEVFATTSAFTGTVYDPYVNVLRATTQAFSGVVGGVAGMEVLPFDSAVRPSDEPARRIARNTQIMMQNEFNLLSPVDPAGGSWYVEKLTAQLAEAAAAALKKLEAKGGILAGLADGSVQQEIAAMLAERFKKLATRADRAVGTNMYANMSEQPLATEPACNCGCGERCKAAPAADAPAAIVPIKPRRWTEQFEALRKETELLAAEGKQIKVFLCNMGPLTQHKPRADFTTGFMEVAGFKVLTNDGFATPEEAAKAALASGADVAVICSTDDTYPELVPAVAGAIKAGKPEMTVVLAGAPAPEFKDAYVNAGVSEFIHVRANCLEVLSKIQNERRGR